MDTTLLAHLALSQWIVKIMKCKYHIASTFVKLLIRYFCHMLITACLPYLVNERKSTLQYISCMSRIGRVDSYTSVHYFIVCKVLDTTVHSTGYCIELYWMQDIIPNTLLHSTGYYLA